MAVVSLLLKSTPSFRSCPRGRSGAAAAVPRPSTPVRLQTLTGLLGVDDPRHQPQARP
jgi:hypothetical protein